MTTTFIKSDGNAATQLDSCDATGTWTNTPSLNTDVQIEGTGCLSKKVSNTTSTHDETITSTDLSSEHVYVWLQVTTPNLDLQANGGLGIRLGDGTNTATWYVGGSDNYPGGWVRYVLDPNGQTQDLGTKPTMTAITLIGVHFKTITMVSGATPNCFWDSLDAGTGLRVTGGTSGTPITYDDVISDDATNAYGVVSERAGVMFVQGELVHGDAGATADVYFDQEDKVIVFENRPVATSLYKIAVEAQATGTNSFVMGNKVGTGDTAVGANGCTILGEAGTTVAIDFSDTDVDTLNIYGTTFRNCGGTITLAANTAHDFIGNTVDNCGQVNPASAEVRNCVFSGHTGTDAALLWGSNIDIKNSAFRGNTDGTNNPAGIEHDTIISVYTGTADVPGSNATTLVDAGATFTGGAVAVNDYVYNEVDGCYAKVTSVDSATQLTHEALAGGTANTWADTEAYSISPAVTYDNLTFTGNDNDVYNSATGSDALFVSKTNGANPSVARNTIVFLGSVSISITVKDVSGTAIQNAQTGVFLTSDGTQLVNADTNASGQISESYSGSTPVEVKVWIRKASSGATRYKNYSSIQNITSSGLSLDVTLVEDPNNNAVS